MANSYFHSGVGARAARLGAIAAGVALGATLLLNLGTPEGALAQGKKAAKKGPVSSWVRVCNSRELKGKDKAGKEVKKKLDICETLTQSIHPVSGAVMVGVNLQKVKLDGKEEQRLIATVPSGVVLPHGAAITVFPKDLWEKAQKKKTKLSEADKKELNGNTVKLIYTTCLQMNCHAEAKATKEVIDLLKSGAGLWLQTVRLPGVPRAEAVSLNGFNEALKNPPTDPKKLAAARAQMAKQIRENQRRVLAEYKKKQEELEKMQPDVKAKK